MWPSSFMNISVLGLPAELCLQTYRVFTMWGRSWKSIFIPTSLILGAVGKCSVAFYYVAAT